MAGPILSYLAKNQPVRNAVRTVFGLPVQGGPVDSMQSISDTDRLRGNDVSNPYPNEQAQYNAEYDADLDAESVPQYSTGNTAQPYQGMGLAQALITSRAEAQRRARRPAATQVQAQPAMTDLSSFLRNVNDRADAEGVPDWQRHGDIADRLYLDATRSPDPVRAKALITAANAFASRAAMGQKMDRMDSAFDKASKHALALNAAQVAQQQGLIGQVNQNNMALQAADRDAASLSANAADYADLVRKNPQMTIEQLGMNQAQSIDVGLQMAGKSPLTPEAKAFTQQTAMDEAMAIRMADAVHGSLSDPNDSALEFGPGHPVHSNIASIIASRLKQRPMDREAIGSGLQTMLRNAHLQAVQKLYKDNGVAPPLDYQRQAIEQADRVLNQLMPPVEPTFYQKYLRQ